MRNRTKKEQKEINTIKVFLVLVGGLAGWYQIGTLTGVITGVLTAIGLLALFGKWRSDRFNKRLQQSGIAEIDQMTGRQFEEYVGTLFAHQGYDVTYTPATGDFGADLILKRDKDVIVVQAKRYKSTVGITAVQEVIPAVKMYHATNAWVISNSFYTKAAITLAEHNQVLLINRDQLIDMIINQKSETNVDSNKVTDVIANEKDSVPDTDNALEIRLKAFRLKKATESDSKAFHIFTNKTLEELIEKRPITIVELQAVAGFGEKRIADFGAELLEVING